MAGGRSGNACRLDGSGGRTATLNDYPNSVVSTVAGTTYRASAWVKAGKAGVQIQARMMEYSYANQLQGQASQTLTLPDTAWHLITLAYTAAGTDNAVDYNVIGVSLPADTYLDIDDVTLTAEANLVVNGTFDTDTSGWTATQGVIASTPDGRGGTRGVKVSRAEGGTATLNDQVNTVTSTVAGTTYQATAWVKASAAGQVVNLRQMEWGTGKVGESIMTYTLPDTGWWPLQTQYTAASTGAQIDLNVYGPVTASSYFVVDDVTLGVYANKVLNSTFEAGTWGWKSSDAGTLSLLPAGRTGYGARLTGSGGGTMNLNDLVNSVQSTVAGTTYTAGAWVKTSSTQTVRIRLMEYTRSNILVGQNTTTATIGNTWTYITVGYVAGAAGATLDLNLIAPSAPNTLTLDVDDISLVAGTPTPDPYAGWHKTFEDEFDGSAVDTTKWKVLNNSTYGFDNLEVACLMASNAIVSSGTLKLRAESLGSLQWCPDAGHPDNKAYRSAHLTTENTVKVQYGRIEMRAKTPITSGTSQGLWPAFWMRPSKELADSTGEIDIFEQIGSGPGDTSAPTTVYQTIHGTGSEKTQCKLNNVEQTSTGFHVYGVEWNSTSIKWYIDSPDNVTCTKTAADTSWFGYFKDKSYYLRLNLAVGGRWPGAPVPTTAFPSDFEVDWVRVWEQN